MTRTGTEKGEGAMGNVWDFHSEKNGAQGAGAGPGGFDERPSSSSNGRGEFQREMQGSRRPDADSRDGGHGRGRFPD